MKILFGGSWCLLYPCLKYAGMFSCLFNETTVSCQWCWFQSLQEVHVLLWTIQLAILFITLLITVKLYEKTHFLGNLRSSWNDMVVNLEMHCFMNTKGCFRSTSTTVQQCSLEFLWPLLLVFSFNTDFQMLYVAHHTLWWPIYNSFHLSSVYCLRWISLFADVYAYEAAGICK